MSYFTRGLRAYGDKVYGDGSREGLRVWRIPPFRRSCREREKPAATGRLQKQIGNSMDITREKMTTRYFWKPRLVIWSCISVVIFLSDFGSLSRTIKQTVVSEREEDGGQPPPKCMYSFVVNELDSAKCPLLLQHMYGYQREQAAFRGGRSNPNYDALLKRVETIEKKMFQEVSENRDLETSLEQQQQLLKTTQISVMKQEANITQLLKTVNDVTHGVKKTRTYYKDLDAKLAGVIMDLAEVGERLRKTDKAGRLDSLSDKHIPVQSAPLSNACGLSQNATKFRDCEDIYLNGHTYSGVYYITPLYTNCPIPVYCDMDTPPGGWMVIQRRRDGSTSFNKNWEEYRGGFGDVTNEYWLGLDNMFLLTNQKHYKLRADLWDFYGSRVYAEYRHFRLDGMRDKYRLHVSNHSGTAPDGLTNHNGIKFSTTDNDNDGAPNYHCAREWGAGWWFNNCWFVILNGPYYNNTDVKYRGISWNDWKTEQLMQTEMKIRPYGH